MLNFTRIPILALSLIVSIGSSQGSETRLPDSFDHMGSSSGIGSKGQSRCVKAVSDFSRWLSSNGAKEGERPFQDFSGSLVSGEVTNFTDREGVNHRTAVVHSTTKSYPHRVSEIRFPISESAKIMKVSLGGESFSVHMKGGCAKIIAGDNHSSNFMCGDDKNVKIEIFTPNPKIGHNSYSSPSNVSTDRRILELMARIKDNYKSTVERFPSAANTELSSRNFKSCLKNNSTSRFNSVATYNSLFPEKPILESKENPPFDFFTRTASK